jgi:DNA replication licensing factor MCM5
MADRQSNFAISLFGSAQGDGPQDATVPSRVQQALVDFVMDFHLDNIFIYRFVAKAGYTMA